MAEAIAITIGRGQGGSARMLSDDRWEAFLGAVEKLIAEEKGTVVVSNDGRGEWSDDEGRAYTEDNHIWVALATAYTGFDLVYVEERLFELAEDYDQDTVALLTGNSLLVGPGA